MALSKKNDRWSETEKGEVSADRPKGCRSFESKEKTGELTDYAKSPSRENSLGGDGLIPQKK